MLDASPKPFLLVASSRRHVDVDLESRRRMFARHSRRAVAVNYLLAIRAVAQHRVGVAFGTCHFVLAKFNHADFRVKGFRALNRAGELLFRFQDEH